MVLGSFYFISSDSSSFPQSLSLPVQAILKAREKFEVNIGRSDSDIVGQSLERYVRMIQV